MENSNNSTNNNNNNTNNNSNNNNNNNDTSTTNYLLTNEMKVSLPLDNSTIHTTQKAVEKFNGVLNHKNVQDLTEYVINGRTPIASSKTVTQIIANNKDGNNISIKTVISTGLSPVAEKTSKLQNIEFVHGGYKFTSDESKLTTILEKRLENDLGQQSEEGNRIFRSNVYTSMNVDAVTALQGKSRMCKTMEVLTELMYAYNPGSLDWAGDNHVFIFDYLDYENTIVRELINRADPQNVITISETNPTDVKLAIARRSIVLGAFTTLKPYIFVLSNCKNPLKCERCVITYKDQPIDNHFSKLRYASAKNLHNYICNSMNFIQNITYYIYSYINIASWNSTNASRSKLVNATYEVDYINSTDYDSQVTGNNINVASPPSLPLSRQRFNIQDYYTALHILVELKYEIRTPYGRANFDLRKSGQPALILPICDAGIRIAHDKNMCKPLLTDTYYIEHRGLLANKVSVLANYRAGRLLSSVTEIFGSLYNCKKLLNNVMLYESFWGIIDAQTVGIYNDEHLIGLVGHKRYSFESSSEFIGNSNRSATDSFTAYTEPSNNDLIVEEYYPLAGYWRADVFGLPEHDEYSYENKVAPSGFHPFFDKYDDKIHFVTNGVVGRCQYQTTTSGFVSSDVYFVSNQSLVKTSGSGMYSVPTIFKTNYFTNYVDSPLDRATTDQLYPVCYGNRVYTSEIVEQEPTALESILFG